MMPSLKYVALAICFLFLSCSDSSNNDNLTQEEDRAQLTSFLEELVASAQETQCNDSGEWAFVLMGDKPCGGHTTALAYPIAQENIYLERAALFTARERAYNIRWGGASDCALEPVPSGVQCINGVAQLVY